MIEKFSLKNFKSIKNLMTIDFTSKNQTVSDNHSSLFFQSNEGQISRLNFFYGKNGSGKSSIFQGLRVLKNIVTNIYEETDDEGIYYFKRENTFPDVVPFILVDNIDYNTFFSVIFHVENNRYQYSLIVNSKENIIVEEVLEKYDKEFKTIFSKSNKDYNNFSELEIERLNTYKIDKIPVLSIIYNEIEISNDEVAKDILNVYRFIENMSFEFDKVNNAQSLKKLYNNKDYLNNIVTKVKQIDLTIDDITVDKIELSFDEFRNKYSSALPIDANKAIEDFMKVKYEYEKIEYVLNISHKNKNLNYSEESSGTKAIINILFSLYASENNVWIIDDFENYLHSEVSSQFIKFLSKNLLNKQLFLITHQLDFLNLLEVHNKALHYFVVRDNSDLSTEIINLTQFSDLRNDERNNWESFYRKFRLGQYPKITLNQVIDKE